MGERAVKDISDVSHWVDTHGWAFKHRAKRQKIRQMSIQKQSIIFKVKLKEEKKKLKILEFDFMCRSEENTYPEVEKTPYTTGFFSSWVGWINTSPGADEKRILKYVNSEILSMHHCKHSSICYIWNTMKLTTLTQFIKEGFHPIISHHRAHQPGLQKSRPFVHKWLLSALIILWSNKNNCLLPDWTVNCFLCTCSFWLPDAGYCSPGTRGPLWPAHLDSLLPRSPDSFHGRRNRVCRHSSLRCQESVSCEQIQVLGNKQSEHVTSIQMFNGN